MPLPAKFYKSKYRSHHIIPNLSHNVFYRSKSFTKIYFIIALLVVIVCLDNIFYTLDIHADLFSTLDGIVFAISIFGVTGGGIYYFYKIWKVILHILTYSRQAIHIATYTMYICMYM